VKELQATEDIVPLGEFKAKASEMLRKLRSTNRPLVITQNGKPAAVVITPEDFDTLVERERFVAAVRRGVADADAGRTIADGELDAELERGLER
jgi:prevent-host-death family protein